MDLTKIKTADLIEELVKREEVKEEYKGENSEATLKLGGGATTILVIKEDKNTVTYIDFLKEN